LLVLNFANPEVLVARFNVDRAASTGKLDPQYLTELSSDAVPTLLASRAQLQPVQFSQIKAAVCSGPLTYAPSPVAFNLAEADAASARRKDC
jgi:Domain of unknown function (DUF4173)